MFAVDAETNIAALYPFGELLACSRTLVAFCIFGLFIMFRVIHVAIVAIGRTRWKFL
jgi:hypothetical protein